MTCPRGPGTLPVAAELTGFSADSLRTDHVANICGGAAVFASYQPTTTAQQPEAWSKAVALYAGTDVEDEALDYADMVFDVLRSGASETTDAGDTVTLAARPAAALDTQAVQSAGLLEPGIDEAECPATIACEIVEAQYRSTGPAATQYVNYDLADRENGPLDRLSGRAQHRVPVRRVHPADQGRGGAEPVRVLALHHPLRPTADVAQHVATRNVAAHAGNWYLNMHSIGFEHEGFAAQPGAWYDRGPLPELRRACEAPGRHVRLPARSRPCGRPRPVRDVHLQVGPGPLLGLGAATWNCWARRSSPTGGAAAASSPSSPGSPTTRSR